MADPMDGLLDFQNALNSGIPLYLRDLDADYKTRYDEDDSRKRFIFAKIINGEFQALAIFGHVEPVGPIECYSVGYAVSEKCRGRGLAVEAINKGIEELKKRFSQTQMESFYVEAVVDVENGPSIKVAEKIFPGPGLANTETYSGKPSLLFMKLIQLR